MAGIYVHIPFCRQACHYCNFHFSTSLKFKRELISALLKEMEIRKNFFYDEKISTVYFGGGTPSLLTSEEIFELWNGLDKNFSLGDVKEVTLEANPEDLTRDYLKKLRETPVNRLSIGIQSFFDEDLKSMNRIHDAKTAIQCVRNAFEAGFENITIDLIYGIPGMTHERWEKNLAMALSLPVNHLSCYALTVEEKTTLAAMIKKQEAPPVDDQLSAEHFERLMEVMDEIGWDHYEISNMAVSEAYRSVHNSNYWSGGAYLGLGPSAHSYINGQRSWNVSNNARYISALKDNSLPSESEQLTDFMKFNEYIMTSLRRKEGVSKNYIRTQFGETFITHLEKEMEKINPRFFTDRQSYIRLSREGRLFADRIASDLFCVEK
jgi:oxygen-independent coproporphyrinogen-3 oxidase